MGRREVLVKVTDRSFLIGTAVTLALIIGALAMQVILSGHTSTTKIAASSPAAVSMVEQLADQATGLDETVRVELVRSDSDAAAAAAVRDEDADAWLCQTPAGWEPTRRESDDPALLTVVRQVVQAEAVGRNAAAAGTTLAALQQGGQVTATQLVGDAQRSQLSQLMGFAFAFLFYVAALMFGITLASSVVEEKQSRIVEIIAGAIPLRQLLLVPGLLPGWFRGPVLPVGGRRGARLAHRGPPVDADAGDHARGADVLRRLFLDGTARTIASFVPPVSALLIPIRMLDGGVAWWKPLLAMVLLVGFAALLVLAAERVYRRALMQTGGKLSLRQAWRLEE
ncbi:MAG: hypothetical protein ABIQ13_15790 [Pedococcus sp.]